MKSVYEGYGFDFGMDDLMVQALLDALALGAYRAGSTIEGAYGVNIVGTFRVHGRLSGIRCRMIPW